MLVKKIFEILFLLEENIWKKLRIWKENERGQPPIHNRWDALNILRGGEEEPLLESY